MSTITFILPDLIKAICHKNIEHQYSFLLKLLAKSAIDKPISILGYSNPGQTNPSQINPEQLLPEQSIPEQSINIQIAAAMGVNTPSHELPIAAIENGMPGKENEWVCIVSPTIISPNRDHLALDQYAGFDLTADEINHFNAEFNDYFIDDGIRFSLSSSGRWLCHSDEEFDVALLQPKAIAGKNIATYIPQGNRGARWRKIFNDIQMLLHHSSTNKKRYTNKKPEFNSLWFWGGGSSNNIESDKKLLVYSSNCFATGLAKIVNAEENALGCKTEYSSTRDTVIVANDQSEVWENIDPLWFEKAWHSLKQNNVDRVTFVFDANKKFHVAKKDLFKFWRNKNSLGSFI